MADAADENAKNEKDPASDEQSDELDLNIEEQSPDELLEASLKKEQEAEKERKEQEERKAAAASQPAAESSERPLIFALRTTANREEQVMDFITSNAKKKKLGVYSLYTLTA